MLRSSAPTIRVFVMADGGEVLTFGQYEAAAEPGRASVPGPGPADARPRRVPLREQPRMLELEGAAERTGLYYTCINSYLAPDEVAYIVNDSDARVVATSAAPSATSRELPARRPTVERWLGRARRARRPVRAAARRARRASRDADRRRAASARRCSTRRAPPADRRASSARCPTRAERSPARVMEFAKFLLGFRERMTFLNPAPLYHSARRRACRRAAARRHHRDRWSASTPSSGSRSSRQYGVTHSAMVPTMFSRLLKLPDDVRVAYDVSSLECIVHAAAPVPGAGEAADDRVVRADRPRVLRRHRGQRVHALHVEEWLAHPGTVGRCVYGELLILDDDGNECPRERRARCGSAARRTSSTTTRRRRPSRRGSTATSATSTVGDIGYVDDDGFLYLTDRKTYMIISGA
jgi:acyl-coenzyme A synthetase/AMP-(fatty) acid ligase